ncbi:hypothetical protein PV326_003472 [Microctonus aethiopoides]|nr:hypothetical protein PV326_003472 [Microctonus aethiopoides]
MRTVGWDINIESVNNIVYLNSIGFVNGSDSLVKSSRDFRTNIGLYNDTKKVERHIFDYRKNGIRLDINLVSGVNNSISEEDDGFPMPPFRALGHCVMDLSAMCIRNRIARYIDTVGRLDKIILFGNAVKFVKVRELPKTTFSHRSLNPVDKINRSINDFFDKFALRITLPGWNKRKEQNQIDFMFDDDDLVEGRGKGGGGGGKGGKGGGKCKQMMMCMMMGLKMKMVGMVGLMMVKGMMMAGISMMMTKAMLLMKLMNLKGSGGGGGHDSGSGGMLKEIVLLTKAASGGGGGGGGGGHGSSGGSSYNPSPPSTYGAPPSSAGSGGYAGGGSSGWGRSFDNRLPMKTFVANDNSQELTDNLSIINSYPDLKHSNHLQSIDSHDYVGEVLEPVEIEDHEKYLAIDHADNEKITNTKTEWENKNDDANRVYAKYWENYEVANKLWDSNGPIVASKVSSIEQLN